MSNLKTLLIILVVIFLVGAVGAEVYYLFFYQPAPKAAQSTQNIQLLVKNSATSYILSSQHEGKIVEIDTKGGIEKSPNSSGSFKWKIKLRIKTKEKDPVPFLFNENDLKKIRLVQLVGDKERAIGLNNLKTNDSIIVKLTWDLKKDITDNLTEGKITRI